MMLPPRRRISPGSPGGTSRRSDVDDPQLEARPGPTDGGGDRLGVVAGRGGRRGAALGEAVAGDHHREGELVEDAADQLHRDVGGAGDGDPQAREVVVAAVRVVEDRLVDRRRARQHRDPLGGHAGERPVDVEHRLGEHRGAGRDRGEDARLQPEHVEVRVHHQVAVAGGEPRHRHPVGGDEQGAGVGLHHALGRAGGAGGEEDVGRVVGADGGLARRSTSARASGVAAGEEVVPRPARPTGTGPSRTIGGLRSGSLASASASRAR